MLPHLACSNLQNLLRLCIRLRRELATSASTLGSKPSTLTYQSASSYCGPSHCAMNDECASHSLAHRYFSASPSFRGSVPEEVKDVEKTSQPAEDKGPQRNLPGSISELMTEASDVQDAAQASRLLQQLSLLWQKGEERTSDAETLLEDKRLQKVVKLMDRHALHPSVISSTLQSLYDMTDNDVFVIQSLINRVLWSCRRQPIPALIQTLQLHLQHQETELRQSVLRECVAMLQRRWVEVARLHDIVTLLYATLAHSAFSKLKYVSLEADATSLKSLYTGQVIPVPEYDRATRATTAKSNDCISKNLTEKLEDRALDLIERGTPKELFRVVYLLSRHGSRNTPLIRSAVYHLKKQGLESLSAVQLCNLLYALAALSMFDPELLSSLTQQLLSQRHSLTPSLALSVLGSFSRLRWKDQSTIQALLELINSPPSAGGLEKCGLEGLSASSKVGLVFSLANLNVESELCGAVVQKVVGGLNGEELRKGSPSLLLDLVWALAVLRMLDQRWAALVLQESFWRSLPATDSHQFLVNLTKLNNINMAAQLEVKGYQGPFLSPAFTECDSKLLKKGERGLAEKLLAALEDMAPVDSFSLTNLSAPGGYFVDAEVYVDDDANPKPLSKGRQSDKKYHRLALKVIDFPDVTLPTYDLTGLNAMAVRHLCCQGYHVIQVRHKEISWKALRGQTVQFLQRKMKEALKDALLRS